MIYFKLENKRIEIIGKHQYVKKNNEDRTLAYSQTLCPIKGVNTTLLSSLPHVIRPYIFFMWSICNQ